MATVNRSVATLRVSGDDLEPAIVTRALGHAPTFSQTKGESLIGKKTGLTRIAKLGMWRLEAADREPADLDAQIDEILLQLTSDLAVWKALTSTHSVDLFCGLFMTQSSEGVTLSAESLAALGSRGIDLGLDIYGGAAGGDA